MRFLIVTAAVFACAAAAPSALLAYNGLSHASLSPVAAPTIPPGDLQAAAIDAHVEASDNARAAVDAIKQVQDQASELQGRAINAVEDHAWQAVDAAQTAQAQVDGAAASVAPVVARQVAGRSLVAPIVPAIAAYSAPAVAAYSAPALAAYSAPAVAAYSAPAVAAYSAPALAAYSAPAVAAYSAPAVAAYSAPAIVAGSQSISSQSLSQSHPAPSNAVYAHAW
ncbi:vitelline membrane protein Vm26Ab-like [Danaus plexippus]|uniref:vitelline membrane protein Vm26Ab-like n=1 Tax=Danaus plexippus TaxID=13037 RepID=UPI002AB06C40|nr:vitelline membrane protein Vm26Ab-like [Danaus plexippus]